MITSKGKERLVIATIACIIMADLLTGFLINTGSNFSRIGLLVKFLVIVATFSWYLTRFKKKDFQIHYISIGILTIFWCVASILSFHSNPAFDITYSAIVLSRYLFLLVLSFVFFDLSASDDFQHQCKRVFEIFLLLNSISIFIGFAFEIDLLSTYNPLGIMPPHLDRFGYKGLLFGGNEVAVIHLIGVAYLFRQTLKYREAKSVLLVVVILATVLTGTKAAWIGLTLISFYFLSRYKLNLLIKGIVPALGIILILVYLNWEAFKSRYLLVIIDRYHSSDILTFLMTNRNEFILNSIEWMGSTWTFLNFIAGDAFSFTETDLLDLYLFFGLGALLYLYIFIRLFFIRDKSTDNMVVFSVLMILAFTGGHFIQSAIVPVFLLLYIFTSERSRQADPIP